MKVITGMYRAKRLFAPQNTNTRPTLQRAKETMFNMLPHAFIGRNALDIFSGSGQLGIEALSRGIEHCIFNEIDIEAINALKINTSALKEGSVQIMSQNYTTLFPTITDKKFDLILIDPPYPIAQESLDFLFAYIDEYDLLRTGGFITGEIPFKGILKNEYKTFKLNKDKKFSKLTRIWQYVKK